MLSKNTRFSIFMRMIFRPFVISFGYHFSKFTLFKIKWRSFVLSLCQIATILVSLERGSHR